MIVGRIRTIDIASRLHGDEFAIFVADTDDYSVAQRIMKDINQTLAKEAAKRNMPAITLSAGAVLAKQGDTLSLIHISWRHRNPPVTGRGVLLSARCAYSD